MATDTCILVGVGVSRSVITLRPLQEAILREIRQAYLDRSHAPCLVAPCGFGKTVVFSAMAESAAQRGKRVLILCHRAELLDQIIATLEQFGVTPEVIAAGFPRSRRQWPVAVASVQTLIRRLDDYPEPTLIVIDECHHAVSNSYTEILRKFSRSKILGVTASPMRLDGRGLGTVFDKLIIGPSVQELTELGYLSPTRLYVPPLVDTSGLHTKLGDYVSAESEALMNKPTITGNAVSHYKKLAPGKAALAFCTSVKHAYDVAAEFRKAGIDAVALEGRTDAQIRRMAVADFRRGAIKVLAQTDLCNEGFDVPDVHCGIFLRPTQSLVLWIQQMGRCCRIAPGKKEAILLDAVGNVYKLGVPAEPRKWELTAEVVVKKPPVVGIRVCPKFFAASSARASVCIECAAQFTVKSRAIAEKEGELIELTPEEIERKRVRREQGRAQTLEQLREIGRVMGRHPRWAEHVHAARIAKQAKKENA
jgi:DNA repair protein RadD